MSVTVANGRTKGQERKWWCDKVERTRALERARTRICLCVCVYVKEREGQNERREVRGGNRPLRRSGVNGTAKVYFVEEKAACHATMGPHGGDVGVPRGPRDQGDRGSLRGRRGRACVRRPRKRDGSEEDGEEGGGEAKGEMQQQQQQLSLPVPPFVLP